LSDQVNQVWYRRADIEITIKQVIRRDYPVLNILSAQGVIYGEPPGEKVLEFDFDTENVT
jgi:hypothetical protein